MTTARAEPQRRPRSGFTLFEIIVVMALAAAVSGLVMTTLVRAQRRFRRAAKAAEARAEIARAAERMLRDIRGARGAYVTEETGALVLLRPDGERVEWRLVTSGSLSAAAQAGANGRFADIEIGSTRRSVEPLLKEGRLVRKAPEDEFVSRARLAGLRVKVEKAAGRSPFVEVGLELEGRRPGAHAERPAAGGVILYVGARPRAGGVSR